MAALTENKTMQLLELKDTASVEAQTAAADTVYSGALVELDLGTGYYKPNGVGTNAVFAGIATQEASLASATTKSIGINTAGSIIKGQYDDTGIAVAGVSAVTDIGRPVYCATDNVFADATLDRPSADARPIGRVFRFKSSGKAWVKLFSFEQAWEMQFSGAGRTPPIQIATVPLSTLADGDMRTSIPLRGTGRIVEFFAMTSIPTTDADADATINLEINTTNLTGGVITMSDTGETNGPTETLGARNDSTAITGNNVFHDGDTLSIEASSVTAYSDGQVDLFIVIERSA